MQKLAVRLNMMIKIPKKIFRLIHHPFQNIIATLLKKDRVSRQWRTDQAGYREFSSEPTEHNIFYTKYY